MTGEVMESVPLGIGKGRRRKKQTAAGKPAAA